LIKLYSINRNKEIHHLIEVGDEFIIYEDEFIRLEFGKGFNWIKHTLVCPDCKAFLDSLSNEKTAFNWYLESENKTFILDSSEFGKNEHFMNSFESRISNEFTGVRIKLKKIPEERFRLQKLSIQKEKEEKYDHCKELRNAAKIADRQ
jgi:uncharacterized protein YbaR (Trm112 family)